MSTAPKMNAVKEGCEGLKSPFNRAARKAEATALIEAIRTVIDIVPEGRALLNFIDDAGIHIHLDYRLKDTRKGGEYNPEQKKIVLSPYWDEIKIIEAAVHEMRHAWQDKQFDLMTPIFLKGRERIVFARLIEGDAFAYGALFMHRLSEKINTNLTSVFTAQGQKRTGAILRNIFQQFQADTIADDYDRREIPSIRYIHDEQLKGLDPEAYDYGCDTLAEAAPALRRLLKVKDHKSGLGYLGIKNLRDLKKQLWSKTATDVKAAIRAMPFIPKRGIKV